MAGGSSLLMEEVERTLQQYGGADVRVVRAVPVGGGSINRAWRLETTAGPFFLKSKADAPPRFFACEADGLHRLREAGADLPQVVAVRDARQQTTGSPAASLAAQDGPQDGPEDAGAPFLLLEWIQPGRWTSARMRELGRQLAAVHRVEAETYGLPTDNFIGLLPQPNRPFDDWCAFYREMRLGVQYEMAARRGRIAPGSRRAKAMERLLERLERWLPKRPPASLLHGDLWSGNVLAGADGRNVFLDPAVYAGHREVDVAFSEYFGGFSPEFYDGYAEMYPLEPEYRERRPLYQLYYLLVHLNLFGESYGPAVDAVLRRYAG